MQPIQLDHRLSAIAQKVRPQAYFADIGTDHGYLPVYLVQSGRISRAVAADINPKPLEQAKQTISRYGLEEQITACLSDGLIAVDPEAEDIAVAGMGGELIAQILSGVAWIKSPDKRLLLQPMTQDPYLRQYLAQEGFSILDEIAAQDGRHLYIIFEVQYTGNAAMLSELDAYTGKCLYKRDVLSQNYIERKYRRLCKIAEGLKKAGNLPLAAQNEALARQILSLAGKDME